MLRTLSRLELDSLFAHVDVLTWLIQCEPVVEKVAAFERKFVSTMVVLLNQPSLADVKARAKEMHDELYEPGAPGFEAAKASFKALAL